MLYHLLPPLSETEKVALDAGNPWWDAELFTGRPATPKSWPLGASPGSTGARWVLSGGRVKTRRVGVDRGCAPVWELRKPGCRPQVCVRQR